MTISGSKKHNRGAKPAPGYTILVTGDGLSKFMFVVMILNNHLVTFSKYSLALEFLNPNGV